MDFVGYPMCETGDALIVLAPGTMYKLHSALLIQHCDFFAKETEEVGGTVLSKRAKASGERVRFRWDLIRRPGSDDDDDGSLVLKRVQLDQSARPQRNALTARADFTQGSTGPPPLFNHYDKIFGAIYGNPVRLESSGTPLAEILLGVMGIADVAETLGCMHIVAHSMESSLLSLGQALWRAEQADPVFWIHLATKIRSVTIFAEAANHLIGRWKMIPLEEKNDLQFEVDGNNIDVKGFCQTKYEELQIRIKNVECNILKYYPKEMQKKSDARGKDFRRMSYSNDIISWIALTAFRHHYTYKLWSDNHRHAEDQGFKLFTALGQGGEKYLYKPEMKEFHKMFHMGTRLEHVVETEVEMIKDKVKHMVRDLLESQVNLDLKRWPVQHFTCSRISRDEVLDLIGQLKNVSLQARFLSADTTSSGKKRKLGRYHCRKEEPENEDGEETEPEFVVSRRKKKQKNKSIPTSEAHLQATCDYDPASDEAITNSDSSTPEHSRPEPSDSKDED